MPKYHITPKRDFGSGKGFYINGEYVKRGFVVTDGLCNVMPAAGWFRGFSYSRDSEDLDAPDFVPAGYTTRNTYEGVTYAIGAIVNR